MSDLSDSWSPSFVNLIFGRFIKYNKNTNMHICALTKQKNDFEHLNKDDILGVVEYTNNSKFADKDIVYIDCLQTHPKYLNGPKPNPLL